MTFDEVKKMEKIANESMKHARQAMKKSDELQAMISLMEYRLGKRKQHSSVGQLFKKLNIS